MDDITDPQSILNTNLITTGEPRTDSISHALIHIQKSAIDPEDQTCAICSEAYQSSTSTPLVTDGIQEAPVKLICGHIFGRECITQWLQERDSCPKCRAHVAPVTRQQRAHIEYTRQRQIIESWRQDREYYIARLQAEGKPSRNALLFIQQQTTSSGPPSSHLEWLAYVVVERPDLLQDDRNRAARYWMRHLSRDRPIFHRVLIDLIRQDMGIPLV